MSLSIRELTPDDAPAFQRLRLHGLLDAPSAFSSSHEEECDRPLSEVAQGLRPTPEGCVFGAFDGDRKCSAACASRFADTGAVTKRNKVISSSRSAHSPCAQCQAMLASSSPPTPSVVALVGACRRWKKSRKRTSPIAPISEKAPPTTSSSAMRASTTGCSDAESMAPVPIPRRRRGR